MTFPKRAGRAFRPLLDKYLAIANPLALSRRHHREWEHARSRRFLRKYVAPGGVGAEVGVFWAHFSEILVRDFKPAKLHLIDPWDLLHGEYFDFKTPYTLDGTLPVRSAMAEAEKLARRNPGVVELHRAYSHDVFPGMPDESFDWVYLDATHDYEGVTRDLEAIWPKLKPDGVLMGDDYFADPANKHAGVRQAVEAFAERMGLRVLLEDRYQYLILRPGYRLPEGLPRPCANYSGVWPDRAATT